MTDGPDSRGDGLALRGALVVTLLAAFVLFGALGARTLETKDVTRTAEIARETLEFGNWLAPTREGELETEKFPLAFWAVAGLGTWTGRVGPLEARLPSAVASLASVLVVLVVTARHAGAATGARAAALLGLSPLFLELGRASRVDPLFAFFLLVATVLALDDLDGAGGVGRRAARLLGSGVALGLAVLTKGPLGCLWHFAALLGVSAVLAARRERGGGARAVAIALARYAVSPAVLVPPVVAALVAAAWFVPFVRSLDPAEWLAWKRQFLFENVQRATDGFDKPEPFFFYAPYVLLLGAPATLFAIPALVGRPEQALRDASPWLAPAQAAWLAPLLLLSVARGKAPRYLLPLLPWLAVAGAIAASGIARAPGLAGARRFLGGVVAALAAALAVGAPIAAGLAAPDLLPEAGVASLGFAVAAVIAGSASRGGDGPGGLDAALLALFVASAGYHVAVLPSARVDGERAWVRRLAAALPVESRLDTVVVFQPWRQVPAARNYRRLRLLLSIYRDDPTLPLAAREPDTFRDALRADRVGLVGEDFWADLAPIASDLVLESTIDVPREGERVERFRLVRRRR